MIAFRGLRSSWLTVGDEGALGRVGGVGLGAGFLELAPRLHQGAYVAETEELTVLPPSTLPHGMTAYMVIDSFEGPFPRVPFVYGSREGGNDLPDAPPVEQVDRWRDSPGLLVGAYDDALRVDRDERRIDRIQEDALRVRHRVEDIEVAQGYRDEEADDRERDGSGVAARSSGEEDDEDGVRREGQGGEDREPPHPSREQASGAFRRPRQDQEGKGGHGIRVRDEEPKAPGPLGIDGQGGKRVADPENSASIGWPSSRSAASGKRATAPVAAATSRASPTRQSASPRFGFTSTSSTQSPYRSVSALPTAVSAGRIRIPSPSTLSRSSSPEQSIPLLTIPIFSVRSMTVARQQRAGQGLGDPLAGLDVPGAAHDLERLAGPDPHGGQRQAIGARVLLDGQELAHHDVAPLRAPALEPLDLEPEQREALRQGVRGKLEVNVVTQPAEGNSHRNCPRKRRSLSRKMRTSAIPWRSIAIRSTPIPKAKPW